MNSKNGSFSSILSTDASVKMLVVNGARRRARPRPDRTERAMSSPATYDWQTTLEECRAVLRHDPDHLGALELLAQAQWFGGQYGDVVRTTSRMLRLNPLEPGYRYTRGMAHLSLGDVARATGDFRAALTQSKDPRFQAEVSRSLDAVERWITDGGGLVSGRSRFAPALSPHVN